MDANTILDFHSCPLAFVRGSSNPSLRTEIDFDDSKCWCSPRTVKRIDLERDESLGNGFKEQAVSD